MRRTVLMLAVTIMTLAAAAGASASETHARRTLTQSATAYFYGPGPASAGLDSFNVDLTVTASDTTTTNGGDSDTTSEWVDRFTVYDRVSNEPLLSCSATRPLPENGFSVASDLRLATLDASASSMEPAGDSTTGFDDATTCPGISLRVLMTWHAESDANAGRSDGNGNCEATRTMSVDASAIGVTLNVPLSTNPSVIQHAPSVTGAISRALSTVTNC